ncbi:MAG: ATP-dependent zinc metalloprotease FtsH [Thermoguttaceae bacterium]|nr:ATP-dependent zinc metalloprotease FtsH [Thermoguttaceae bacterium]
MFGVKSTEITWTAFNKLLDSNEIVSAELKGSRLSGTLREAPALEYWPDILPNGVETFAALVDQYDRVNPEAAANFNKELDETSVTFTTKTATNDQGVNVVTFQLVSDDSPFRRVELPADSSEKEQTAAKKAIVESYKLGKKLQQRWRVAPIDSGSRGGSKAFALVDAKTGKASRKIFYLKYSCEAPAFAFSDQTIDAQTIAVVRKYTVFPLLCLALSLPWVPAFGKALPEKLRDFLQPALTVILFAVSVLFLLFLFRMLRNTSEQMMGGGFGGFGGIARSLAKRYEPNQGKTYTFDDVAGLDAVKAELVEIVDYLKNPKKYERMGARVPKGTLLFGPPGTGKTLLARAVAGEANVPFFSINGSEFIQMFVGVGASRVRDLFTTAKENAPSILFIDEIDAVGRQRGAGVGGGQDEREQTLNQILSEMDGFNQNDSVMVMASTNRPDVLDPALMRPGRFDRHITVGRPSMRGRVDIFKVYLKKIPCGPDVDVDKLAKTTAGFTGADIRNFVNEATLWATRNGKDVVEASDFDFAFEKISLGLKRDEIISPENKRKTAYHEAGHALVGWFMPNGSKVHKITIIPRGRALGVTWSLPDDDQLNYNESEARATLMHLLAGRAAEKLIYGENSSGVENDLQRATELARNMITRWGMSDTLGPVAFPDTETHPFLGREMSTGVRSYSEDAARLIDIEVRKTIEEADAGARKLLEEKRELFEKLTNALVEEEELDEARIREILGPSPNDKKEDEEAAEESSGDSGGENGPSGEQNPFPPDGPDTAESAQNPEQEPDGESGAL